MIDPIIRFKTTLEALALNFRCPDAFIKAVIPFHFENYRSKT
jgi:hypothetical protein